MYEPNICLSELFLSLLLLKRLLLIDRGGNLCQYVVFVRVVSIYRYDVTIFDDPSMIRIIIIVSKLIN